jgi:hypothetical protein
MVFSSLSQFNFVKEWDEPKGQVIEAMKSNANQLTNLIKSPLTPDKDRQLNKKELEKIKPFWGESFLTWQCMQKLLDFDNDKVVNTYCQEYLAR